MNEKNEMWHMSTRLHKFELCYTCKEGTLLSGKGKQLKPVDYKKYRGGCVYLIFFPNKAYYVGHTGDLYNRTYSHYLNMENKNSGNENDLLIRAYLSNGKNFNVYLLSLDDVVGSDLELAFIHLLNPPLNVRKMSLQNIRLSELLYAEDILRTGLKKRNDKKFFPSDDNSYDMYKKGYNDGFMDAYKEMQKNMSVWANNVLTTNKRITPPDKRNDRILSKMTTLRFAT